MILLEKQCVSLELTRRLKELSVKQDGSQFYWIVDDIRKQGKHCVA